MAVSRQASTGFLAPRIDAVPGEKAAATYEQSLAGDARRHSETIDGIEYPGKQTVPNYEQELRGSHIAAAFRTESGYRHQDCSGHERIHAHSVNG